MRCHANRVQRQLLAACAALVVFLAAGMALGEEKTADNAVPPKQKILQVLKQKLDFDFVETPFADVIEYVRGKMGVEVMVDHRALNEVGIATDIPITFSAKGISFQAALGLMLRQLSLTWIVTDEVLLITTPEEAQGRLETRVYPVEDLAAAPTPYYFQRMYVPGMSDGGFPRGEAAGDGSARPTGGSSEGMGVGGMGGGMGMGMFQIADQPKENHAAGAPSGAIKRPQTPPPSAPSHRGPALSGRLSLDMDTLINAITTTVKPESWDEVGGAGSIACAGGTMIISQTQEAHHEIESLLENLRAVSPGLRVISIRATWLELDLKQLDALLQSSSGDKHRIDRNALAEMAGKTQGYLGAIACFSGQTVHIASGRGRSAVVGAIPIVGDQAAYQPVVNTPYAGAVLEVTPQLLPNTPAVLLDLCSTVTKPEGAEESVRFLGRESADGKDADVLRLDRVKLSVSQLATTLKVPLGEPTLVGGLTRESSGEAKEAAAMPQLYLFIEATAQ